VGRRQNGEKTEVTSPALLSWGRLSYALRVSSMKKGSYGTVQKRTLQGETNACAAALYRLKRAVKEVLDAFTRSRTRGQIEKKGALG